jgi:hypothetical protein
MFNKMYEWSEQNTRNNNQCVRRHALTDPLFSVSQMYLAAIWLKTAGGAVWRVWGEALRLNSTWTILWKTFNTGLGFHLQHGTWQFKHFKWQANPSIVTVLPSVEHYLSRWPTFQQRTTWKVAGSIPDGVARIFHWHNPFGRTTVLGSTQPLT